jgi:hypothetical protein
VKLIKSEGSTVLFRLGKRETVLFRHLLDLYPCIPPGHHPLSRSTRPDPENQRLLDEALAEQRTQYKAKLEQFITDPARFRQDSKGLLLSLTPPELEWLLQVLNDVRVGSWIKLGAPEQVSASALLEPGNAPEIWAMEMCGYFQAHLLSAYHDQAGDPSA